MPHVTNHRLPSLYLDGLALPDAGVYPNVHSTFTFLERCLQWAKHPASEGVKAATPWIREGRGAFASYRPAWALEALQERREG